MQIWPDKPRYSLKINKGCGSSWRVVSDHAFQSATFLSASAYGSFYFDKIDLFGVHWWHWLIMHDQIKVSPNYERQPHLIQ